MDVVVLVVCVVMKCDVREALQWPVPPKIQYVCIKSQASTPHTTEDRRIGSFYSSDVDE